MTDLAAHDRTKSRNRIRFIDLAMDGVVGETLKLKKDIQLAHLTTTLPELCAASHFIDEDSDVGVFVAGWNGASAEDRKTPPEAISVDTTSGFTTHKIIDRILRRAVGSVRSLPLYRAHKPMFAPYPEEIETALTEGTVHEAFEKLFKQMIA